MTVITEDHPWALLGAADRLHQTAGTVPDPDDAFERQAALEQLIDLLGRERFEEEYAKGFAGT